MPTLAQSGIPGNTHGEKKTHPMKISTKHMERRQTHKDTHFHGKIHAPIHTHLRAHRHEIGKKLLSSPSLLDGRSQGTQEQHMCSLFHWIYVEACPHLYRDLHTPAQEKTGTERKGRKRHTKKRSRGDTNTKKRAPQMVESVREREREGKRERERENVCV